MTAGSTSSEADRDVTDVLVGFARTLRAYGVEATPDRLHSMLGAVDSLDVTSRDDVYWAGRLTLCATPDEVVRYHRAFESYFGGEVAVQQRPRTPVVMVRAVAVPIDVPEEPGGEGEEDTETAKAATASGVEVLRHRDLARLGPEEREQVRRMIAMLAPKGPVRRSRRRSPASRGDLDARRTVREMLRRGGEPALLERHAPKVRPRRLVVLADVSGSMQAYADATLRFAHAAARVRPGTEVFTLGTRLTRVSREIRGREPDAALEAVSAAVPDWSGGTRLGEQLKAFLDRWGQRGTARGAVVVVFSDGWERGDATLLGEQMQRLHRLAHRVVWVNPHKGKDGFVPATAGMRAVLPFVDALVAGHSLAAFQELVDVIADDRPPMRPVPSSAALSGGSRA